MKNSERKTYRVAGHRFCVIADESCESWKRVAWHYEPFAEDDCSAALFTVNIVNTFGEADDEKIKRLYDGMSLFYDDKPSEIGMTLLRVFRNEDGAMLFEIQYPQSSETDAWMIADKELCSYRLLLRQSKEDSKLSHWVEDSTLSTSMMLCFMLSTTKFDTLTMHSSCVLHDGMAYLFLGKSGTGKSTHSRLWLKNIADTILLNDDHPIIRIDEKGSATAYGSPWSGKTDCYRNEKAKIGGIVKIEQAPRNEIRKLAPLEAYSRLIASASGITWFDDMASPRHKTIERLIGAVPCYELKCLPDDEAALLCHGKIVKSFANG